MAVTWLRNASMSVINSLRRYRMKDGQFQRELDDYQLNLYLNFKKSVMMTEELKADPNLVSDPNSQVLDNDAITTRCEKLSPAERAVENMNLLDLQVRSLCLRLAHQVNSAESCPVSRLEFITLLVGLQGKFLSETLARHKGIFNSRPTFTVEVKASRIPGAGLGVFMKVFVLKGLR